METPNLSKHQYTIKKEEQDPKASLISKSNVDVEFTVYELEANLREMKKMVTQLTAQKKLADAKMSNIEAHHPFVQDLTEEQAFTVHMYQEARAMSRVCGQKLPEYENEVVYIEAELKEIEKQIGVAIPISAVASDENVPSGATIIPETQPAPTGEGTPTAEGASAEAGADKLTPPTPGDSEDESKDASTNTNEENK